jgi:Transglutaminase-like superfamily
MLGTAGAEPHGRITDGGGLFVPSGGDDTARKIVRGVVDPDTVSGPRLDGMTEYAEHSRFSDPGQHRDLLTALPAEVPALAAVVRNVLVHYRGAGLTFTGERLAEIDNRWVERILDTDQRRFGIGLATPRPLVERVAGCCRDFTLLTVAALRERGVAARSRIGFAAYFMPDFHCDHVVVEYRAGDRWVYVDAQLDPAQRWPWDPCDMPRVVGPVRVNDLDFATAAQVWRAIRRGEVDPDTYGVDPGMPHLCGVNLVRHYVLMELAHRRRDELLLWDVWSWSPDGPTVDDGLIDEVAELLLTADSGDEAAEQALAERYASDARLNPGRRVRCMSPSGLDQMVDIGARFSRSPT